MRLLFVTWDGPQVDYLQGLFLPIFRGLREHGVETDVLQFGWGGSAVSAPIAELCAAGGFGYRRVEVIRRLGGGGALASALLGAREVRRAVCAFGSSMVMPRSLMPALAVLAARLPRSLPILFDADGLAADERVDFAGLPQGSAIYRTLRGIEAQAIRRSAAVMVRTTASAEILQNRSGVERERFHVVANGRDEALFAPLDAKLRAEVRAELGIAGDAPLLVYAGSVGPQYRFDALAACAAAVRARSADAHLLVLSGQPDDARAALGPEIAEWSTVRRVPAQAVGRYLASADAGFALRSETLSTRAVAPVKLSEYLLCGVPVIGTASVGDTAAATAAGVFFDAASGAESAAEWVLGQVIPNRERMRQQAREVGVSCFSLSRSVEDYRRAIAAASVTR